MSSKHKRIKTEDMGSADISKILSRTLERGAFPANPVVTVGLDLVTGIIPSADVAHLVMPFETATADFTAVRDSHKRAGLLSTAGAHNAFFGESYRRTHIGVGVSDAYPPRAER